MDAFSIAVRPEIAVRPWLLKQWQLESDQNIGEMRRIYQGQNLLTVAYFRLMDLR